MRTSAALLLAGAAMAFAAPAAADTAQAQAEVVVVSPLSFFNVQGLSFGKILPSGSAGTVRVEPNGARSSTGGVTLYGSTHQEARFAGMGVYNQTVRIRLRPAGASTINLTRVGGGGTPMQVNNFEIGSTPNTVILTPNYQDFNLGSPTGQFNFGIGARLMVGANQAPGTYTGTFTLQLIYQ